MILVHSLLKAEPSRLATVRAITLCALCLQQLACSCTAVDCHDVLSVAGEAFSATAPRGEVEAFICRGDFCEAATFHLEEGGTAAMLEGQVVGSVGASVIATEHDVFRVGIGVTLEPGGRAGEFASRERILVDLTRPDGSTVGLVDQVVDFETVRPNGEYCSPVCTQGRVEMEVEL